MHGEDGPLHTEKELIFVGEGETGENDSHKSRAPEVVSNVFIYNLWSGHETGPDRYVFTYQGPSSSSVGHGLYSFICTLTLHDTRHYTISIRTPRGSSQLVRPDVTSPLHCRYSPPVPCEKSLHRRLDSEPPDDLWSVHITKRCRRYCPMTFKWSNLLCSLNKVKTTSLWTLVKTIRFLFYNVPTKEDLQDPIVQKNSKSRRSPVGVKNRVLIKDRNFGDYRSTQKKWDTECHCDWEDRGRQWIFLVTPM